MEFKRLLFCCKTSNRYEAKLVSLLGFLSSHELWQSLPYVTAVTKYVTNRNVFSYRNVFWRSEVQNQSVNRAVPSLMTPGENLSPDPSSFRWPTALPVFASVVTLLPPLLSNLPLPHSYKDTCHWII